MDRYKIKHTYNYEELELDYLRAEIFDDGSLPSWDKCLNLLKENELYSFMVYSNYEKKLQIDLSFLKEFSFLKRLEWLCALKMKSNIEGMYYLSDLQYLRWYPENNTILDLSSFPLLKVVLAEFHNIKNITSLLNLDNLCLHKLNEKDCRAISPLKNITKLKLTSSKIVSLEGLEECKHLEKLKIHYCPEISDTYSVINQCPNIHYIEFISCKKITKEEVIRLESIGKSVWIE